jgi:hypothetical protein
MADRWMEVIEEAEALAKASPEPGDGRAILAHCVGSLAQRVVRLEEEVKLYRDRYQEEIEGRAFLPVDKLEVE